MPENVSETPAAIFAALPQDHIEATMEFIRMLQTPGPHDLNVLSFIRNHLLDPELRAQRGKISNK